MRIVVMGSGGVGGYFGAKLAQAGADVAFVARGAHLAAIRERGLEVRSPLGDLRLERPVATDDPASLGKADLVLFSVKLWDTEPAARAIVPLIGPDTAVVSLQNGVGKDEELRGIVGSAAVMGGVCYIATRIESPGVIEHSGRMQKLVFGEYGGERSRRAERFFEACASSGIDAEISADIHRSIWEKFVFLVGLSGTTAATRRPIGAIRGHPRTRAFLLDAMRETVAVGRALGVGLHPDYAQQRLEFCDTLPAAMTSSMHHDLERGNRLEVRWLSGEVVHRGEQARVPTPVNRAILNTLVLHEMGRLAA
jgi:2-dehydropantoate 2-reductase